MSKTINEMYVLRNKTDPGTFYARTDDNFFDGSFGDAVLYTRSDAMLVLDPRGPLELARKYEMVRLGVIIHSIILKTYK